MLDDRLLGIGVRQAEMAILGGMVAQDETFYGELETAPMIQACPVNIECRLVRTVEFPQHDVFIGQIVATYCDEACLTEGAVDLGRVAPILFAMVDRSYWTLGRRFARAWQVGNPGPL
jgi:flavin reductase (DIM6/NTAB) family NADH-FMN oxidoreductase RutF